MQIALTDYSSLEEVLRAIRDLPYEGGSRRTGDALQFLVDTVFSPVISRDHAPKVQCFSRGDVKTHPVCLRLSAILGLFGIQRVSSTPTDKRLSCTLKQSQKLTALTVGNIKQEQR